MNFRHVFMSTRNTLVRLGRAIRSLWMYGKYREFTMAPRSYFL